MSQPQQNITVAAPGFRGLNTQESPVNLPPDWASVADNCVIDRYGRIGARKGRDVLTADPATLGTSIGITAIKEHKDTAGAKTVFSTGNSKIFSGTTTLTDITPAAYTITADNWKIVNFNYHCYFFQIGQVPLAYSLADGALTTVAAHTGATGTPPNGNEVLAAFGRLWVGDIIGDKSTVYWSNLLDGTHWTGGTTGSLDLTTVWPTGFDEVVAITEHNNFLIIFGMNSIVVYSGASNPATMVLADTIPNIGCVARDSVVNTGTDLLFMSNDGLRSFTRTIQEKSMPLTDLSKNVRKDIISLLPLQLRGLKGVFSPENAFYLLSFPTTKTTYCFDLRTKMEDGTYRVTMWPNTTYESFERAEDGTLYVGCTAGISTYSGYLDISGTYLMRYFTHPLSFGDSSKLKFPKELDITIIGGQNTTAAINWGYDYSESYKKQAITLSNASITEFDVGEYNDTTSQYSASIVVSRENVKPNGSGTLFTMGLEVTVNGVPFSVQEINIQALLGRIV
jgi:hypothetical protein